MSCIWNIQNTYQNSSKAYILRRLKRCEILLHWKPLRGTHVQYAWSWLMGMWCSPTRWTYRCKKKKKIEKMGEKNAKKQNTNFKFSWEIHEHKKNKKINRIPQWMHRPRYCWLQVILMHFIVSAGKVIPLTNHITTKWCDINYFVYIYGEAAVLPSFHSVCVYSFMSALSALRTEDLKKEPIDELLINDWLEHQLLVDTLTFIKDKECDYNWNFKNFYNKITMSNG